MTRLVLARRDDADYKIELVRWQQSLRGFFGCTQAMVENHKLPLLFLKSVWVPVEFIAPAKQP